MDWFGVVTLSKITRSYMSASAVYTYSILYITTNYYFLEYALHVVPMTLFNPFSIYVLIYISIGKQ